MQKKIVPLPHPSLFTLPSSFSVKAASKTSFRWARFPQWNSREKIKYLAYVPPFAFSTREKKSGRLFSIKLGMPFERLCQHWNGYCTLKQFFTFLFNVKGKKMMQIRSNVSVLLNKNVHSKTKSYIHWSVILVLWKCNLCYDICISYNCYG